MINLVLDYPLFAFGPMKMTVLAYDSVTGLVYLTFPIFGLLRRGWPRHKEPMKVVA